VFAALSIVGARPAGALPPPFPAGAEADTLFGVVVPDPYRRLERGDDPAVASWIAAQEAETQALLAAIPGRDALAARIGELRAGGSGILSAIETPARLLLVRQGERGMQLTAREPAGDGWAPAERVLFDAAGHAPGESPDFLANVPSLDGRQLAIGRTRQGDGDPEILVVETATGQLLPDRVGDILLTSGGSIRPTWHPDGSGFFYPRAEPGATAGERFFRGRLCFHRLGSDPAQDEPVFGFGLSAAVPMAPADTPSRAITAPSSRWLVAYVWEAASFGIAMYATPLDSLRGADTPWRCIGSPADELDRLVLVGDVAYALSAHEAPRGRLVRRDLGDPAGAWETALPERPGVLVDLRAAADALYLSERIGGAMRLHRLPYGAEAATPIALPLTGTLSLHARSDAPGVRVAIESWLVPPQSFRYEPASGAVRSAGIKPPVTTDFAGVVAERSAAPARDGAAIPVSIVHSRTLALDGRAPLLLEGYGTAGVAVDPLFQPELLAWVERGGIYAFAHVRGGGELGDAWHEAARRERRPVATAGCSSATPSSTGRSSSGRRSTMSAPPTWSAWPASRPAPAI
jgi:prolyl oligopeptidase